MVNGPLCEVDSPAGQLLDACRILLNCQVALMKVDGFSRRHAFSKVAVKESSCLGATSQEAQGISTLHRVIVLKLQLHGGAQWCVSAEESIVPPCARIYLLHLDVDQGLTVSAAPARALVETRMVASPHLMAHHPVREVKENKNVTFIWGATQLHSPF